MVEPASTEIPQRQEPRRASNDLRPTDMESGFEDFEHWLKDTVRLRREGACEALLTSCERAAQSFADCLDIALTVPGLWNSYSATMKPWLASTTH